MAKHKRKERRSFRGFAGAETVTAAKATVTGKTKQESIRGKCARLHKTNPSFDQKKCVETLTIARNKALQEQACSKAIEHSKAARSKAASHKAQQLANVEKLYLATLKSIAATTSGACSRPTERQAKQAAKRGKPVNPANFQDRKAVRRANAEAKARQAAIARLSKLQVKAAVAPSGGENVHRSEN